MSPALLICVNIWRVNNPKGVSSVEDKKVKKGGLYENVKMSLRTANILTAVDCIILLGVIIWAILDARL